MDKDKTIIKGVDPIKRRRVIRQLQENIETLNDSCDRLRSMEDFFKTDTVADIKKLSGDWLRNYVRGVISSIDEDARMPKDFKDEIKKRWDTVLDGCSTVCDTIYGISHFDGVQLRRAKGRFYYDQKEVEDFATKEATVTISDKQAEYYHLLQNVADSLNTVQEWERNNGINGISGGVVVPNGSGTRTVSLLDLIADENGYRVTPDKFLLWVSDGFVDIINEESTK